MTPWSQLLAPLRQTAKLVAHVGARLDALSLDLARDLGAVARDAQAFAAAAQERATTASRVTPRAARLAQAAAALLARQRWLRLVVAARGDDHLSADEHRELARCVAGHASELRGGIAKLAQLASCRPDLIGPIWAGELAKLQDEVPPVDAAAIRAEVEAGLGRAIGDVFASFDDAPLAAASLAQVHAATLLDDHGARVVVKVQVPGIRDVIAADIAALEMITSLVGELPGVDLRTITGELARALTTELDYVAEADAIERFATSVIVPRPIRTASSDRVLTMTRIDGAKLVPALDALPPGARDKVLAQLVDEVAAQILVRGTVHADPHPGNFLITPAGELALVDFGCVLELSAAERAAYARLVLAIGGRDHAAVGRELAALGFSADDPAELAALAASIVGALVSGASAAELDWQAAFADQLARARQLRGLTIPRSFVLLGRVLVALAGLLATYRPRIELHALIGRHLAAALATSSHSPQQASII